MALYECVFIARQDISSAQVDTLTESFAEIISSNGGEVKKRESWGLRTLAYRVKKNRKGHYMLMNIDAPSAAVAEMERIMRLNEDVLRFMTLRVEELEEGESAILTNKGERGERGDRGDRGDRRGRGDRGDRGDRNDRGDRGDRPSRAPRPESTDTLAEGEA